VWPWFDLRVVTAASTCSEIHRSVRLVETYVAMVIVLEVFWVAANPQTCDGTSRGEHRDICAKKKTQENFLPKPTPTGTWSI